MSDTLPNSVKLVGDGDEVDAITDVERAFSVKLDYADAAQWRTAGDVFCSLQRALPPGERDRADLWDSFVEALCGQTFVDPRSITPESPLLDKPWRDVRGLPIAFWIIAFVCLTGAIAAALV